MSPAIQIMIMAIFMTVAFAAAWAWAARADNYSWVDAAWAFGIGVASFVWLLGGKGDLMTRMMAALLVVSWSLRLGVYLCRRIRRMHPKEDPRYMKLRDAWKTRERSAFFLFFQVQGISVVLLALPFLAIAQHTGQVQLVGIIGACVAMVGLAGESLADHQKSVHKRSNPEIGSVCRSGLWRYSRHPNYFFEAVIWWGFYIMACGAPWGWATIHAPLIITWLLLRVTGIPPTEAAALAAKGDAYRAYQSTTSAFIPLPPKKSEA